MSTPINNVILESSDVERFEVDEVVALQSVTIKNQIEDLTKTNTVTVANVKGEILAKVIEYCKKHVNTPFDANVKADLKNFDNNFLNLDLNCLLNLVKATNYLNIPGLQRIVCQAIANNIKDKQPEDIRSIFNIENSFSKEEEDQLKKEDEYTFEI